MFHILKTWRREVPCRPNCSLCRLGLWHLTSEFAEVSIFRLPDGRTFKVFVYLGPEGGFVRSIPVGGGQDV